MACITPDDVRRAPKGVSLKNIGDVEIAAYIGESEDLAASYLNMDSLGFRTVQDIRTWQGDSLRFNLRQAPVRTITRYVLLTGVMLGKDITFDIDAAPVAATGSASVLPTNLGGIKLNRAINGGDASAFLSSISVASILGYDLEPEQIIEYTAGWDDGTAQADGYTLPYPEWLKTAVRLITIDALGEWETGRKGMTGLQQLRVADAVFRKPTSRSKNEVVIPLKAQQLLNRHFRVWMAGA